jgi:hypothetical protein
MDSRSPDAIAEEWILKWPMGELADGIYSTLDWDLPKEQPDLCLAAILEVLQRIDSTAPNKALGVLAAGPLEDLLNYNGERVVDQVDLLARRDPGFRLLLNGVWDSNIPPSVLTRLAKYRGNRW